MRRRSGCSEWVYCWARKLVDGDFIDFWGVIELPLIHSRGTYPGPYQLGRRLVKSVNLSVRRPKRLDVPIWSQILPKQEDAYRFLCPLTYNKKRGGLATSRSEQIFLNVVTLLKQFYPYSISPGNPKIEQGGREQGTGTERRILSTDSQAGNGISQNKNLKRERILVDVCPSWDVSPLIFQNL